MPTALIILESFLCLGLLGSVVSQCSPVSSTQGGVDITKTLYACAQEMDDPELIYSFKETISAPVDVYAQMALNNLIEVPLPCNHCAFCDLPML